VERPTGHKIENVLWGQVMPSFLLALSWLRDLDVVPSATILTTSAFAIWMLLPPNFVDGILPALHHWDAS